jgi:hypothetical protein
MKRNVIVYGLISGLIVSAFMAVSMLLFKNHPDMEGGMVIGYASMIMAFAFIFVGIKNFRDKYNNKVISFGKAFKIGFFIALIASTMYVVTWVIEYNFFIPDFMDLYAENVLKAARAKGASEQEISAQVAEMAKYREMYKNPVLMVLMTYMEILPVGVLVSLIAAAILKKKSNPEIVTN